MTPAQIHTPTRTHEAIDARCTVCKHLRNPMLTAREKLVIWAYDLNEQPLSLVARSLGISSERVRQIRFKAFRKIRAACAT